MKWGNYTTHKLTFPVPQFDNSHNLLPRLTPISNIASARLNLIQSNPDFAADNWDVFALGVSLSTPGFPVVRPICLIGDSRLQDGSNGLVRLSKNPGSIGNGPHSPPFSALSAPPADTPLAQIQFTVATGHDDLGGGANGSSATAAIFVSAGHSFTVTLRPNSGPHWDNFSTNKRVFSIPAVDDQGSPIPPFTPEDSIMGVQINLVQSNPSIAADNWDILALEVDLLSADSSVVVPQIFLLGSNSLQDGSMGLVRLSLTAGSSGSGPSSPVYTPNST